MFALFNTSILVFLFVYSFQSMKANLCILEDSFSATFYFFLQLLNPPFLINDDLFDLSVKIRQQKQYNEFDSVE